MKKKIIICGVLFLLVFITACTPKGSVISANGTAGEKGTPVQRDDLGCWPPSCSIIPDPQGKKLCEEWKAGKPVAWPSDCSYFSGQPACQKLCESEKKGAASGSEQTGSEQKQAFNVLPSLVKAEFASDVTNKDKLFVIQGISAMDFYLKKWFGKSTNKPAGLRVEATPTTSFREAAKTVTVKSGVMNIEIKTKSPIWEQQPQMGGESHPRISAHEYVHIYQFQNGCGNVGSDVPIASKWFIEGEAEWLSYKVMQEVWLPSFSIERLNIPMAKQAPGSLKFLEKEESITSSDVLFDYALFTMAIDYLMKDRDIKTLDDFCANIGKGQDLPTAFQNAFGISLDKFYQDFEAYRKTWNNIQSQQQEYCSYFASVSSCSSVGPMDSDNYKYCKQCFPDK